MASPDPPQFDLSKLNFEIPKMKPTPGVSSFAGTREEAIANSAEGIVEFQKAHPNVDFKAAIVEPTVNFYYDMKVYSSPIHASPNNKEQQAYVLPESCPQPFPNS